jgi:hypothetical protein
MNIRTTWFALIVALVATFAIVKTTENIPYNDALIRLQTKDRLAAIDPAMANEPLETQVLLLNYSKDNALLLKTWFALKTYPKPARELLKLYGSEADFKEVVLTYGEAAIPVIKYFVDNEIFTLKITTTIGDGVGTIRTMLSDAWDWLTGSAPRTQPPKVSPTMPKLDPTARGWFAVQFIKEEGHQFLGQFAVTKDGVAKWNLTDRVAQGVIKFLTGGMSKLERKVDLNQDVEASDVFFAAVDVIPFVVAAKLLRVGKVATAGGKELSVAGRTRILAPRLIPKSPLFAKLGKYSVIAATAYVVVTNPGLINSLLAELAGMLGVPPWLFQGLFWFVVIFIVTYPFRWILKLAARTILSALSLLNPPRSQRSISQPQAHLA